MSRYTVIVSRQADAGLIKCARFLAQVSIPAAQKMIEQFESIVDRLEDNPFQFPVDEDENLPSGVYRKALFAVWYKVLFTVDGSTVFLDAVVDMRQKKPKKLSSEAIIPKAVRIGRFPGSGCFWLS